VARPSTRDQTIDKAKSFIADFAAQHGRLPKSDEIAAALGYSGRERGNEILRDLAEEGYLRRVEPAGARYAKYEIATENA
jgi:SOS-response transcriptional repressor LexA